MEPQEEEEGSIRLLPLSTSPHTHRRSICSNCQRPNPVCLCHALPANPIPTTTRVFILHHPQEAKHKLSTTPILTKSLLHATAITGRRLRRGTSHLFDQFPPAVYLFPSTTSSPAVNISDLNLSELKRKGENGGLILIAFDATWKHAKEMVKASEEFLSKFAVRVCLGMEDEKVSGGSIYDSELILRKEPFGGCVSTMEAVARALRVLEPNGVEIEAKLIGILREMVTLQAGFLKPVKPRPKLLKKKQLKEVEKSESSENEKP
ncbi:tRNA-uridine aminocarboxypropyltransferase A isoform X2 [Vicia villosa]|uniref:tRNA-uridine aminocarboxypropyltransferase A isoform X2 n=1 Tax=Vicia villosa TaxID=3911 RepID=UPI00273BF3A1|nr:tRNA-uridine aminocarboxypropyltransferase A isoform X2 [Vicia villosa]